MTRHTTLTHRKQAALAGTVARPMQLLSVMLLGGLMIYMAGFLGSAEVHNAAHDMRHSIGFPCH
jgi:cobalt transporter subunit CbtB